MTLDQLTEIVRELNKRWIGTTPIGLGSYGSPLSTADDTIVGIYEHQDPGGRIVLVAGKAAKL